MLRPVCSLPTRQLMLLGQLLIPRSDAKVSLDIWGLLPGAPTLTGMGLTPTEKTQRAMSSALWRANGSSGHDAPWTQILTLQMVYNSELEATLRATER